MNSRVFHFFQYFVNSWYSNPILFYKNKLSGIKKAYKIMANLACDYIVEIQNVI